MMRALPLVATTLMLVTAGPAAAADIGRVLIATGETVAVRDKQVVRLAFGSAVQDRDVLRTGAASTLHVRFIDESMLALRENSEIRIDEFRFSGKEDGSERGFFSLLKGGLRKITGLVGRTHHQNYRMGSIAGTIGIRGTDYASTLCQQDCRNPDGTLARDGQYTRVIGAAAGTSRLAYTNQTREQVFGIGETFFVADVASEPRRLLEPPPFVGVPVRGAAKPPAGTGTERAASGGARQDPRGTTPAAPAVVLPLLLTGTSAATEEFLNPVTAVTGTAPAALPSVTGTVGFIQAYHYSPVGSSTAIGLNIGFYVTPPMLTLSGSGSSAQLTAYNIPAGTPTTSLNPASFPVAETGVLTGSVVDTGSASSVNANWGRWESGNFTDLNGPFTVGLANGGMHYMMGDLAPPDVIAAKTATSVIFSQIGGTTPTNSEGQTASSFNYPGLSINFTSRVASLTAFTWTFPSSTSPQVWSFPTGTANIVIKPQGAGIEGFNGLGTCSGGLCSPSTSATLGVSGTFYGAKGDHLGAAFGATSGTATASGVRLYSCAPSC